jgi:hypothetical protein
MPDADRTALKARAAMLRASAGLGALIGYGCLIGFLYLVGMQVYHWFRDGEWTHVGLGDGLRIGLARCCGNDLHSGKLADFLQWLDSPEGWLGLHRVVEVVPASLALFLVSIAGNCLFIYSRDRVRQDLR